MHYGRTSPSRGAIPRPLPAATALIAGAALAVTLLTSAAGIAAGPSPRLPEEQVRFFETRVRPVLVEQCVSCHGPFQQRSGLRLDSAAALQKGGARGALVQPGNRDASLLWKALNGHGGAPAMPPGRKLAERQLADLGQWIEWGAPFPEAAAPGAAPTTGHWSFQPVRLPAVPRVKDTAWVKSPVDAFILADLERQGLKPAPPADRRTLIRRATFDLTGLPPTPAEVEAFVNDRSADAWTKVVDRLLASPAYGERWGRHWLDVARYADSNGLDENVHYGNAWRYRDWVVRAFNEDKPYDRFLVEQLAGDLLPAESKEQRHSQLIATGFLAIGPKFISEVDSEKVLMDMADEQLDTVGRTVMGLTLGCARCHDHKFDPISQKDYYALAGIFKSTKTLEVMKKPRMWFEYPIPTDADLAAYAPYQKKIDDLNGQIAAVTAQATEQLRAKASGAALPKNPEGTFPPATRDQLKHLRADLTQAEKDAPELPAAMGLTEGQITDLHINIRGDHTQLGDLVPRRFPLVLAGNDQPAFGKTESGRLEMARWLTSPTHPLTGRVVVNRVWRWHFGRGIVGSTENFGLLGERPTNPPLLDYLAAVFTAPVSGSQGQGPRVKGRGSAGENADLGPGTRDLGLGWSFKRLHRLLMLSNTYQMSAAPDAHAAQVDPANQHHWRAELQRLDAEEVRDSLLAASGLLDRTMGGRSLALKNREYIFDHTSKDATQYNSHRRTLYLPVIRNNIYDVLQIFDFGDGAVVEGNRPTTTVAPQALFMLNSDLVMDAADALAKQALQSPSADPGARVDGVYQKVYGRAATAAEKARAATLLPRFQQQAGDLPADQRVARAWSWYCHTLLAANEFIYLR